jgi:AraC-like DNA-binding protein
VWFDETLRLILPPLSVLVIASAVFLLYVTFNIYRPINRLMRSVVMEKPETARDEIDYLETAYRRTFDKQGRLVGLIESISPNILENLIREFIAGHELDERSALDILNNIGNPIGIRDRFCVMVGSVVSLQKENPTEDGISLYCADVRKTVESLCVPDARLFFLLVENNLIVVVIDFPSIVSLSSVRQSVMRLEGEILGALKNDSKRLIFGRGKVYSSVYDLRYSYQEALDDLKYAHYCLEGNKDVLGDAWQINDKLYRRLHVEGRAMHIVNSAEAGNAEEALQLSERVIQEVQENTEDTRSFGELCGFLRDAIIKTLNSRYSTGQNLRLNQMWDDCDDLSMIEDAAIIQKRIGEFCAKAIDAVIEFCKKSQYKYITKAQKYIMDNFSVGSLSLIDVSNFLDINSSYLSELFKNVTGQSFTYYLGSYRVEKAKQMLKNSELTIKEVGFCCGFNSPQNFIRVFKRMTDLNPGQYKNQCRQ